MIEAGRLIAFEDYMLMSCAGVKDISIAICALGSHELSHVLVLNKSKTNLLE
jgi:hypothetical protein